MALYRPTTSRRLLVWANPPPGLPYWSAISLDISRSFSVTYRFVGVMNLYSRYYCWSLDSREIFRLWKAGMWLEEKLGVEKRLRKTIVHHGSTDFFVAMTRVVRGNALWLGVGFCGLAVRGLFDLFEHLDQVFGQPTGTQ